MRLLVEIALVCLLLSVGWRQPYRDQAASLFPGAGIAPSHTAVLAAQHLYQEQHPFDGAPDNTPRATPYPAWSPR